MIQASVLKRTTLSLLFYKYTHFLIKEKDRGFKIMSHSPNCCHASVNKLYILFFRGNLHIRFKVFEINE